MHGRWTALILIICALLPCVCTAEDARPRLDAAQYIVYRISDGKYRVMDFEGRFVGEDTEIQDSSEAYAYQYSVINAQGEELVPFQYDLIEYDEALNAYICYIDDEIAKVYEIRNGTMVEKVESPHIMMERQNKGGMKR